jgi:hypothetical protein
MMTPSWAIGNGNLYVALLPQAVVVAHDYAGREGESILDSAAYHHVIDVLAERPHTSILVNDLATTAPVMYQQFMMFAQMASGMLAMQGGPAGQQLTMILPPLARIQPYLEPAGSLGWSDAQGWHLQSTSPFIGATMLSPSVFASTSTLGIGAGVLLPALSSARSTALRMEASTQMRGIHQASITWANSRQGHMSSDVGEMLLGNYFTAEYILSPESGKSVPKGFDDWPDQERAKWARQHTSFIILPDLRDTLNTEEIAGFGIPEDFDGGFPVVYQDNHTEWVQDARIGEIRQKIREQNDGLTMDEAIAIQRNLE